MKSFLQLMAVTMVFLLRLSAGNPVKRNDVRYNFCSCSSKYYTTIIFDQVVSQHSCVLEIDGTGNDVNALEAASDCCCIATFEVEVSS